MALLSPIFFLFMLCFTGIAMYRRVRSIRQSILLGKKTPVKTSPERWRNLLFVALGQRKMFKRIIPALLHLLVYVGFVLMSVEVLEFIADGILGKHRVFAPFLGGFYTALMNGFEVLAASVLFASIVFLLRRNVLRTPRFHFPEMTRWPKVDANLILCFEIILVSSILVMNAADQCLQGQDYAGYPATGPLYVSRAYLVPFIAQLDTSTLHWLERICWWMHVAGIMAFAVYVTYSKHLHIFMAFPAVYYARLTPLGQLQPMPAVAEAVRSMLGITPSDTLPPAETSEKFGAKDIDDFSRHTLLSAYACTECGRCASECPATLTGKKLSPRRIMMAVRDRLEDAAHNLSVGSKALDDGKSLLNDYITKEEIYACTSCNACVEACPILLNPLDIIVELRRYVAMEEAGTPPAWNSMFQNIETNFAPWKFPTSERTAWNRS